jgi:hypothetical protein
VTAFKYVYVHRSREKFALLAGAGTHGVQQRLAARNDGLLL